MSDPASREQTFFCTDGGQLRYFISGKGQPVVLIHGFGLDASMWKPQWPVLQDEFRAIRYDLRGFGGSTVPTGPYSHSEDLFALLDSLEARPAHLVGLSMGGHIALRFVLEHPNSARSLTVIGSALEGFSWSEAWTRSMGAIVSAARSGDAHSATQLWLAHELFAPARREAGREAALAAMIERYSAWHWRNADPARKAERRAIEDLSAVACPALVIAGELDLPDFQTIARRLAAEIPGAKLATVAGAGHMANMEASAAVNELLLAHLRANV
jgi:pimeloyl-ACP methyl ester carboxylesterase